MTLNACPECQAAVNGVDGQIDEPDCLVSVRRTAENPGGIVNVGGHRPSTFYACTACEW